MFHSSTPSPDRLDHGRSQLTKKFAQPVVVDANDYIYRDIICRDGPLQQRASRATVFLKSPAHLLVRRNSVSSSAFHVPFLNSNHDLTSPDVTIITQHCFEGKQPPLFFPLKSSCCGKQLVIAPLLLSLVLKSIHHSSTDLTRLTLGSFGWPLLSFTPWLK